MNLQTALLQLEKHIQEVPEHFKQFSTEVLLQKPAPGKWSKQEILGHLIDSAINNLKRFTDTQYFPQPYTVIRYNQDELVVINRYQQLPLEHLLQLWSILNKQILNIISAIPTEKLAYTVINPSGDSKTLEWLAIDYVEHMEHHLKQIG
ncbi:MAG TPA: DinB family protein [Niastella sp.]